MVPIPRAGAALAAALAATALVGATLAAPAQGAERSAERKHTRPDLVVSAVGAPPTTKVRGSTMRVKATVLNRGRAKARRTTVRLSLSTNRTWGRSDRTVGTVRVKALKRRARTTVARIVRIPATLRPGRYYVVACVDPGKRVRESREGNNCRSSRGRVRVTAPKPPPPPPPPPPGRHAGPSDEAVDAFVRSGDAYWYPLDVPTAPGRTAAVTVDDEYAVTETIDETGGEIAVTTATGDRITLAVPKDALFGPVTITATPIASLAGTAAVGSRPIGLSLAPDGLTMLRPATMTVVPAAGGVARPAVAVIGQSDGSQTQPGLLLPDVDRLAVSVSHFSTASVVLASVTGGASSPSNYFSAAEYQASLSTEMKDLMRRNRDQLLDTGEALDGFGEELQRLTDEWFDKLVKPKLAAMVGSCAAAEKHANFVVGSLRDAELMGTVRDGWNEQVFDGIRAGARRCLDEMPQCRVMDRRDLTRWMALARQLELVGGGEAPAFTWCHPVNGTIEVQRHWLDAPTEGWETILVGISGDLLRAWTTDGSLRRLHTVAPHQGTTFVDLNRLEVSATPCEEGGYARRRVTDRYIGELDRVSVALDVEAGTGQVWFDATSVGSSTARWNVCDGTTYTREWPTSLSGMASLVDPGPPVWDAESNEVVLIGQKITGGPSGAGTMGTTFKASFFLEPPTTG